MENKELQWAKSVNGVYLERQNLKAYKLASGAPWKELSQEISNKRWMRQSKSSFANGLEGIGGDLNPLCLLRRHSFVARSYELWRKRNARVSQLSFEVARERAEIMKKYGKEVAQLLLGRKLKD
ncbi:hypothetical protein Ancab_016725 [Ancistrocladus abbreviatus]